MLTIADMMILAKLLHNKHLNQIKSKMQGREADDKLWNFFFLSQSIGIIASDSDW